MAGGLPTFRISSLSLAGAVFVSLAPASRAQYPLVPSPVLDIRTLKPTPRLGGYISVRGTERNDSTGFIINRARLTVMAAPRSFLAVRVQGDFSGQQSGRLRTDSTVSGFTLTDAYVQLSPPDSVWHHPKIKPALILGQFKQPFSLEYLTSFAYLKTANRSQAVDNLTPKRDIGAMGEVRWSRYISLAAALTNGKGPNSTSTVAASSVGREFVTGRLTVTPLPGLAFAGELANQGNDHLWGYDGRFLWRRLSVEAEDIHRKHPLTDAGDLHAGGGYFLIAYKVRPWLEPVYKWDRYWETRTSPAQSSYLHSTWNTVGVNLLTREESLRVQLDWVIKSEKPAPVRNDEVLAQVIANF
jgi:Phosphate-selective porin O and P